MILTKFTVSAAIFSVAVLIAENSENNAPKEQENIINDTKGLSIDLKWNTSKNDATALVEADLDLDVVSVEGEVLSSYNKSEFEHVDLTSLLANGTYVIRVSPFDIQKKSQYTVEITGSTNGKKFSATGVVNDGSQSSIDVMRIVKSGNQFTFTKI